MWIYFYVPKEGPDTPGIEQDAGPLSPAHTAHCVYRPGSYASHALLGFCRCIYLQLNYLKLENDPVGSVSIFKRQPSSKTYQESCEVGFQKFDRTPRVTNAMIKRGLRVGGEDFTTFSMVRLLPLPLLLPLLLLLLLLLLLRLLRGP